MGQGSSRQTKDLVRASRKTKGLQRSISRSVDQSLKNAVGLSVFQYVSISVTSVRSPEQQMDSASPSLLQAQGQRQHDLS